MTTPVYAVTGASGRLGRLAVEQLTARGVPPSDIVALVRTPAKAVSLAASGVQVRQADYSRPATLPAALSGVNRLLLVSGSEVGHLVPQHTNVIEAAKTAGISRIVYTSMLKADHSTSPLAGEHHETERVLREAAVPHTVLRNGYYTEGYTDHLGEYLAAGEIIGAAGHGRMSTATRQDYATAAAAALLSDEARNPTYELGGPAYDVTGLAQLITDVTGTKVTYRDLSADGYAAELQRSGMDETTARFVAALDVAVARGDLQTSSTDLADLLGRPATGPADVVHAAYDLVKVTSRTAIIGLIGAGRIGGTLAGLAVDAGYHVVLSNDRGPATLSDLAARLGPSARAATPTEAAGAADLVVVAVPLSAYREIPAEQLVGKVVLDATNYMPDRDGHIAALDDESATSSQLLQARMAGSHLVKAFNTVFFGHLPTLARPRGAADRNSLAIAGDDQLAKNTPAPSSTPSDTTPTTSACSAKAGASSPAPPHTHTVSAGPSTTRSRPRRSTSLICSRAPGTTATTELPRISPTNAHLGEPAVVMGALPGTVLREVPRSVTGSGTRQPPWPRLHAIALTRVPTEIPAWPRLLDRWTPDGGH